jgi:Ni2+-binding GTPase involved in maturation of urease and hydrogenase
MQIHLLGGFLGSGKTTAIIAAARQLMVQNKTVGIITNDQGKYLVDTGFFKLSDLPTVEVNGGCFCCNYDDLNASLDHLIDRVAPDVIFAESVGSCADLVATVIKPFLALRSDHLVPSSFSVFSDSRLLRLWLLGQTLPFSENIIYIFEKQIEEAGLVVINKIDLLSPAQNVEIQDLFACRFPGKPFLLQNTLQPGGINRWLNLLAEGNLPLPGASLQIDYARYGAGEAGLVWLDELYLIDPPTPGQAHPILITALQSIAATLEQNNISIGHLKFLIRAGSFTTRANLTAFTDPNWLKSIPYFEAGSVEVLLNGRVQIESGDAAIFRDLVHSALTAQKIPYRPLTSSVFRPTQPHPTYRFATS